MNKNLLIGLFLLVTCKMQAQSRPCWDSLQRGTITYTQKQFDELVAGYIRKAQRHVRLDTTDYIRIVQIDNTLFFNQKNDAVCPPEKNELYNRFNSLFSGKPFFDTLTKYLGTCIPNHGMGCYYARYKLDWGGASPNDNSLFKIVAD